MLKTRQAQFLAIEDEATAQNIWARKRIRFTANIIEIDRKNDEFDCLARLFAARHGPTMDLIRDFTDFHMLKLVPTSGVMVLGFAKAYQLDGPGLDIAEHLRES
jgi:putative heme iron utilization protein